MTEEQLEKKIAKTYKTAEKEIKEKFETFMEQYETNLSKMTDLFNAGQITQAEYSNWLAKQIIIGDKWETMCDDMSNEILNANNTARALINGNLPYMFAEGMNYGTFEVEQLFGVDTAFTLYDKQLVTDLIEKKPKLLPQLKPDSPTKKAIQEGRIKRWSVQKIRSQVIQGIVQGDSIPKLASRLRTVTDMSYKASIRNARTANTSARNAGHEAAYERASDLGIDIQQMWIAALDDRTRHEHRLLDGQIRNVGEPFEVDGYKLMFPADPAGEPEMVYNCRCRIIAYNPAMNITLEDRNTSKLEEDYETWKYGHQQEQQEQIPVETVPVKKEQYEVVASNAPNISEWQGIMQEKSDDVYFDMKMAELEGKSLGALTEDQRNGIVRYTGSAYDDINGYIRSGYTGSISEANLKALNDATEGLNATQLGETMILRRGTDFGDIAGAFMEGSFYENKNFITDMIMNGKMEQLNETFGGALGLLKSFTSTSSHYDRGFSGSLEVLFFAPAETKASSIMTISMFGRGEGETLLAPNTTVKWLGLVEMDEPHKGAKYRLYLQIIP